MYIYKSDFSTKKFLENRDNIFVKNYLEALDAACDEFRGKPIPVFKFSELKLYEETGERIQYERAFFDNVNRLQVFALRSWLFEEKEDVTELENILWAFCNEYSWALPAHFPVKLSDDDHTPEFIDLFAAEIAHTIAETLSLCGELLNPVVVKRCVKEVFRRVIEPFENYQGDWKHIGWWETGLNNWSAVCGGEVGMTCIYLIEDEKRLKKLTDRLKNACNCFVKSCTDDGVCLEGIGYWDYAMNYYISFDELLRSRTGESIVVDEDKIRKLIEFSAKMCLSEHWIYNFADGGNPYGEAFEFGCFCKINERYGISIPQMPQYRVGFHKELNNNSTKLNSRVRTVAWFNPALFDAEARKTNDFFASGQIAILRSGNMAAGAKGGFNAESHNHNDVGAYKLVKNDIVIAEELEAAVYSKDYFKGDRYGYINAGSQGHNLPIINGYTQSAGKEFAADAFEETENGVKISFAGAYCNDAEIKSLERTLTLDENGFKTCDSFVFNKKGNTVTERLITMLDVEVKGENAVAFMKDGEQVAVLELCGDCEIKLSGESFVGHCSYKGKKDNIVDINIIELVLKTDSDKIDAVYIIK